MDLPLRQFAQAETFRRSADLLAKAILYCSAPFSGSRNSRRLPNGSLR